MAKTGEQVTWDKCVLAFGTEEMLANYLLLCENGKW